MFMADGAPTICNIVDAMNSALPYALPIDSALPMDDVVPQLGSDPLAIALPLMRSVDTDQAEMDAIELEESALRATISRSQRFLMMGETSTSKFSATFQAATNAGAT